MAPKNRVPVAPGWVIERLDVVGDPATGRKLVLAAEPTPESNQAQAPQPTGQKRD